jgi:hypothetical protein
MRFFANCSNRNNGLQLSAVGGVEFDLGSWCLASADRAADGRWAWHGRQRTGKAKFGAEGAAELLAQQHATVAHSALGPKDRCAHGGADTLAGPPPHVTHWTCAAMAAAIGISASSVQRSRRAHGPQPLRVRQFKLSKDPQFVSVVLLPCSSAMQ